MKREIIQGTVHKRTPQRPAANVTDIYVSRKSRTAAIVKRIRSLMVNQRHTTVTLHGLGATISHTLSIALAAQVSMAGQVELKPNTDSVVLIDDVVPEDMDKDLETQERVNSAVHIKMIAKPGLTELQRQAGPVQSHPSRSKRRR
ncbi:hypothetical protein BDF14DRAFT_1811699 [Spinellus fusiger]|nr:hypothetical protein BDF14DRAFT_1811699 [Spinellus fusiger]